MNPTQKNPQRALQDEVEQLQDLQTVQVPQAGPSSVKRHKICQVCHDSAQSYHLNYGVNTCLGCRAFFRRTVQKGPDSLLPCRNGDACEVTAETRRQCQKCRYMKCLNAGMQVQSVLDEGQKKERFRKMIKKQKRIDNQNKNLMLSAAVVGNQLVLSKKVQAKRKQMNISESETGSILESNLSSVEIDANVSCQEEKLVEKDSIKSMTVVDDSRCRNDTQTTQEKGSDHCKYTTACILNQESRTTLPHLLTNNHLGLRKRIPKHVQWIRHSWTAALKLTVDPCSQFAQDLLHSHLGKFSLTKSALKSHLMSLAAVFRYFALQQPEFTDLPFLDQHRLLCRNIPTFIQFVISMYLSAEDPEDQIRWMMLHSHLKMEYDPKNMHFMSLFVLNDRLSLFKDDCCAYLGQLDALYLLRPSLSSEVVPFFALACLFSPTNSSLLDNAELVYNRQQSIHTLIRWKHKVYGGASFKDLSKALLAVECMTDIFERTVDWESESNNYLFSFYSMPFYNMDILEQKWLQRQFDSFYKCFVSVSCGEEYVLQYLHAVHQKVVPTRAFHFQSMTIFTERARRLLTNQKGFKCMSSERRAIILASQSIVDTVIMQCLIVGGSQTGVEQIKYLFGCKDNAFSGDSEITALFQGLHVSKIEFKSAVESNNFISKEAAERVSCLSKELHRDLKNVNIFMLFMYALVFSHDQEAGLQQRYIRHLVQLRELELKKDKETKTVEDGWEWYGGIMKKFQAAQQILKAYMIAVASADAASKLTEGQN